MFHLILFKGTSLKRFYLCFFLFIGSKASIFNLAPEVPFPAREKEMVICIPSYNNELYYKKNLDSVFSQEYTNYRVIYIDDASTDNTLELVTEYVKDRGLEDRLTLIHNNENRGATANWYKMVHMIDGDAIVISLDGDDFLAHDGVLRRINQAYADERVWVTYGNYSTYPAGELGHPYPVRSSFFKRGGHRTSRFYWSHLRTFYAALFQKMPLSQFQDASGQFYPMSSDVAIMQGLIDMAPDHVFFIPSVLYRYNRENVLNDDKIGRARQKNYTKHISTKPFLARVDDLKDTL
ncbi:MAG: hypothetical protein SP4CHLAM5_04200 [Chlamydiia bacterium]|nr:hypothetical protein [Chlamydiia bacterium]MCH9618293.1 hypothetical protein [Chlamydiia bacterium]MCH9624166.1 hypothetical protein [Chlamydiia bacterium]